MSEAIAADDDLDRIRRLAIDRETRSFKVFGALRATTQLVAPGDDGRYDLWMVEREDLYWLLRFIGDELEALYAP